MDSKSQRTEPALKDSSVSDAEIAAAAGIADEDSDLPFVRSYIERASWRQNLDDDILEEFLNMVYGEANAKAGGEQ